MSAQENDIVSDIGSSDFIAILESCEYVLVDFYADWCGPCKNVVPVLNAIAAANPHVKVVKVNIDTRRDIAELYQIKSIPTLIMFHHGKHIADGIQVGFRDQGYMQSWIDKMTNGQ